MKKSTFTLALAGVSTVAAGSLWLAFWMVFGLPRFPWQLACVHALVNFGHGMLLKEKAPAEVTRETFLIRLIALYAVTTAAVLVGYCESSLPPGNGGPGATGAAESVPSASAGQTSPGAVSLWAGVIAWWVVRMFLFPNKSSERASKRPDFGTYVRTGKDARELAKAALPPGDAGLAHGGTTVASVLARLGILLVGSIGAGKTTLLRLLLQCAMCLPAIRPARGLTPGSDCRAWVLDVKREMVPIILGIVGDNCPVIIMTPTDLRSRKWAICEDVKDDATCFQFAKIFTPDEPGQSPFWLNAVQTVVYAALLYLVRKGVNWDLRDLVLILEDEDLTRQVVDRLRANKHVRKLFNPRITWESIQVTLAVKLVELRMIAAMNDHCQQEVSLDWWSRNEAILVFGTDPSVDQTLKVLTRIMFKRTSELLLARGPDGTGRRFSWLVLDELPALEKLEGLSELCLRGRAGGNCIAATIQSVADVRHWFQGLAAGLLGQLFSRAFLRTDDPETAEWMEKCVGTCEFKEWFENTGTTSSPQGRTVTKGMSEQRVQRPAFSREDFQNMAPASPAVGIPGVWKSDLGETFIDRDGNVRKIVTTWFDILSREATFDKLVPPAPDTPGFIPRPPEHQHLRPFNRADFLRLKLTPPAGFMKSRRNRP